MSEGELRPEGSSSMSALRAGGRPAPEQSSASAPFFLLTLYVALVYLRPFEYQQFAEAFAGVPVLPVVMGLMLVAWLLMGRKDFSAPQYPLMIGLFICIPWSTLVATRWISGAQRDFSDFLPIVVMFLVAASTLDSPARLKRMFAVVATACTVIAWHGIDQAANEIGWSGAQLIVGRITYVGFLNDPNDLAMALLMAIPMALTFAGRGHMVPVQGVALGAVGAMFYAVYLTNSRGAILATIAMIAVFALGRYGWRKGMMVGPVLLAAALVLAPDRMADVSADEESASDRIEAWYEGFLMLKGYPLFGVGRGEFVDHHVRTAHNSFVLALAELGVVGYFFWISMIALSVLMLMKIRNAPPIAGADAGLAASWNEHQRLARTLLYSATATLVAAFFLSRTYIVILYLLIAMIVGLYQSARRTNPLLPAFGLRGLVGRLVGFEFASIVVLWLVTRILLAFN